MNNFIANSAQKLRCQQVCWRIAQFRCYEHTRTRNRVAFSSSHSKPSSSERLQEKGKRGRRPKRDHHPGITKMKHLEKTLNKDDKSTLFRCNEVMLKLLQRRHELPPPPMDWIHYAPEQVEDDTTTLEKRSDLYKDVLSLIQAVDLSIQTKRIQASSGREIRELSTLLGNILLICSESPPKRLTSVSLPSTSQSCTKVLSMLKDLNLDVQNIHNFCTIRAANQEQEWELAASLFRNQINPDFHGLVPVDPSLGWDTFLEMGLFGLAKYMIDKGDDGIDVVEGVLDAVRDMVMVSPTDREKYIMAAGSALGRAGHWNSCVEYLLNNSRNNEFGQSLFASTMNACYMCDQHDAVLDLYYDMQEGSESTSGEWQWEGEFARSHPLCTDLLLRSVGMRLTGTVEKYQGFSEGALLIFHQLMKEDGRITFDAIKGILIACANDANYDGAIEVLRILQTYQDKKCDWKVVTESLDNFIYSADDVDVGIVNRTKILNDEILASVMETCCTAGEFGLALLCIRTNGYLNNDSFDYSDYTNMADKLLANQPSLFHSTRLLNATLVALDGLQCSKDADILYSKVESSHDSLEHSDFHRNVNISNDASEMNTCWNETYNHIDRLISASRTISQTNHQISEEDKYNISLATALMLNCAMESNQVNAGIEVGNIVASSINPQLHKKSIKDTVKSFFGIEEGNTHTDETFWFSSDELFSATLRAHKLKYGVDRALNTFLSEWNSKTLIPRGVGRDAWAKTINASMELYIEKGDFEEANTLFMSSRRELRTPDLYLTMAEGYKKHERWNDVAACYNAAKKDGCLSESLCFLAMEGIVGDNISGKVKILRSVTNEIAMIKGLKAGAWIADNYWILKRHVGFHYARLLMWWNDPNETQLQEFRLASQHLTKTKKIRTNIDFDALAAIINLAEHQTLHEKLDRSKEGKEYIHPPPVVLQSMLELHKRDDDVSAYMVLEGMMYLNKTKSKAECIQYLNYIESNDLRVDEQLYFLARTTAGFAPIENYPTPSTDD